VQTSGNWSIIIRVTLTWCMWLQVISDSDSVHLTPGDQWLWPGPSSMSLKPGAVQYSRCFERWSQMLHPSGKISAYCQ